MKYIIGLFVLFISNSLLSGQNRTNKIPFIIQGQISNCPEKYLKIFFKNDNGQILIDTLHLDESGRFYLKTYKLTRPQQTSIQQNNIQINDIFVAPGYNLTITGNGKDFRSLYQSKIISGIGSESNQYRILLDSILLARRGTKSWFELPPDSLLDFIAIQQKIIDSVRAVVFDKKPKSDKYLKYFGEMVNLDNKFSNLYMLVTHVNIYNYSYDSSISFVRNNFDHQILDNLYKEEYLLSNSYRNGFITNEWLAYLTNLDYKKDSAIKNQKDYALKKISTTYKGKVKEYSLNILMESSIEFCKTFSKLNELKEQFDPYISTLESNFYKNSLENKIIEKENELLRTQVGKPAPKFTIKNNVGEIVSLGDFKGKVIYIDLWASWCAPCRKETPYLQKLHQKFKANKQIVIISIAVRDGHEEWKKALQEDSPEWIQLIDENDAVWRSYVANTIPKFIVIDKKGNIVDFNAPAPSSGEKIEQLLIQEMEK
ncbi:TlpA family protein disulfide reductase [Nostoc sp. UIC 10890]